MTPNPAAPLSIDAIKASIAATFTPPSNRPSRPAVICLPFEMPVEVDVTELELQEES